MMWATGILALLSCFASVGHGAEVSQAVKKVVIESFESKIYKPGWADKHRKAEALPADVSKQILGTWVGGLPPDLLKAGPLVLENARRMAREGQWDYEVMRFEPKGRLIRPNAIQPDALKYEIGPNEIRFQVSATDGDKLAGKVFYIDGVFFKGSHEMGRVPLFKVSD